jgi:hypothetical protein
MADKKKFKTAPPLHEGWEICISERDEDEYFSGWCDATLQAEHWFSMPAVGPTEAAMVLCGFNPNEDEFQTAVRSRSPEIPNGALRDLEQQLQAEERVRPGSRTLQQWFELVRQRGLKAHPWVERYINLRALAPIGQLQGELSPPFHIKGERWTEDHLAALVAYRNTHTEEDTAKHYGISQQLVRRKVAEVKNKNSASQSTGAYGKQRGPFDL